ncbi:MAG TPA: AAA family ATPase [Gemmatimonadaceae bacterium]
MRIAVSGSHATGKSTLVAELGHRLHGFTAIEEPYHLLEDDGYVFSNPPTADDFETLIDAAVAQLAKPQPVNVLFDRSPADYLAYLVAVSRDGVARERVDEVARSLATLDLVVFVPIESPDRIAVREASRLRRRVDAVLHEMFVDRAWLFDVSVLTVHGTTEQRAAQVQARLASARAARSSNRYL